MRGALTGALTGLWFGLFVGVLLSFFNSTSGGSLLSIPIAMLLGAAYKVKINDNPHKGLAMGVGVTGGYSFVLDKRWSLELTAGAGYLHRSEKKKHYNQLFPLKLGVNIVYILK